MTDKLASLTGAVFSHEDVHFSILSTILKASALLYRSYMLHNANMLYTTSPAAKIPRLDRGIQKSVGSPGTFSHITLIRRHSHTG